MTADIGSGKGWTRHHLCQSVRGTLANTSPEEWVRMLEYTKRDDGTRFASWHDLRDAFFDELAKGHEVIPLSKDCVGFDFKTGCPGHPMEDPPPLRLPGPPRRHRSRRATMSETTNKMRDVAIYSDSLIRVRDLAADAIEAVEAKVAEAVARVAALEKRGIDAQGGNRSGESPAGKLAPTGSSESGLGTDRGASSAHASPPAPSAVPAPLGFREGDICRVIESKRTKQNFLVGCEGRINPYRGSGGDWVIDCGTAKGVRCFYNSELTLVRAAAAPEAPAEDAGLVERCAEVIWRLPGATGHWADLCEAARLRFRRDASGVLATLRAESRLCAPGEVARLTAEFYEANASAALQSRHAGTLRARAEAAEKDLAEARAISAATAERVRNETQIATELRKDLADARDRIASKDRSIEVMLAETRALREALDAERSGVATKLHDAGFNNVENLVGAYRFERAQADALRFSARTWFNEKGEPELLATAEEVTERRKAAAKELAALKSKPRFRTRKVTKADVEDFIAHDGCFYESLRALGFRRRVEQSK